jgi:hypothetical protein
MMIAQRWLSTSIPSCPKRRQEAHQPACAFSAGLSASASLFFLPYFWLIPCHTASKPIGIPPFPKSSHESELGLRQAVCTPFDRAASQQKSKSLSGGGPHVTWIPLFLEKDAKQDFVACKQSINRVAYSFIGLLSAGSCCWKNCLKREPLSLWLDDPESISNGSFPSLAIISIPVILSPFLKWTQFFNS